MISVRFFPRLMHQSILPNTGSRIYNTTTSALGSSSVVLLSIITSPSGTSAVTTVTLQWCPKVRIYQENADPRTEDKLWCLHSNEPELGLRHNITTKTAPGAKSRAEKKPPRARSLQVSDRLPCAVSGTRGLLKIRQAVTKPREGSG